MQRRLSGPASWTTGSKRSSNDGAACEDPRVNPSGSGPPTFDRRRTNEAEPSLYGGRVTEPESEQSADSLKPTPFITELTSTLSKPRTQTSSPPTPKPRLAETDHCRASTGECLSLTDVDGHRITAFVANQGRAAARSGAAAPPPGPRRGPDPQRQGHRPDQPPAARLRPEPDLVRPGRPRSRTHRLDPTPRLRRAQRETVGTQTAPLSDLHRPRRAGQHRTTHPAPPRGQITVGRTGRSRDPPTTSPRRTRLTPSPQPIRPAQRPRDRGTRAERDDTRRTVTPTRHNQPRTAGELPEP